MNLVMMAEQVGLHPKKVASTHGGEYKSACPKCGGKDRFFIQPNRQMKNCLGYYCCRKCGISGDSIQFARDFLKIDDFKEAVQYVGGVVPDKSSLLNRVQKHRAQEYSYVPRVIVSSSNVWKERAALLVEEAHQNIWSQKAVLEFLKRRGLPEEAVKVHRIGWWIQDTFSAKEDWGTSYTEGEKKKVWIPQGIVIPLIDRDGSIQRIKIRRKADDVYGKYIIISEKSDQFTVVGDPDLKQMIFVEAELDAFALHHAVGDLVFVVAVGSNVNNPDNRVDFYAQDRDVLICHDNDTGGQAMLEKFQSLYPHTKALPTPFGKDIGEAIAMGLDVRQWIVKHAWIESPDLELIEWILNYISERTVTRSAYVYFEKDILLGPDSPKAKSGKLRKGFMLMKELIEKERGESA